MNRTLAMPTGPKYFGTAHKKSCFQQYDKQIPGPGAHSPKRMRTIAAPEWKIGQQTNRLTFLDPHLHQNPSPQHYSILSQSIEKNSKKMTIPLSKYRPRVDVNEPHYSPNPNPTKKCHPQFSFGYFQETDYSTLAPGPGAYETFRDKISYNKAQKGFSSSLRPPPYGECVKFPGAAKYSISLLERNEKCSFGRASKEQRKSMDPPAGFYDISTKHRTFRVATQASQPHREPSFVPKNQVPASNVYNNLLPSRIPNGVMEVSKRTPIQHAVIINHPSPDKYAQHGQLQTSKMQTFAKQPRQLSVRAKTVPGPGEYEAMHTLSTKGAALPKKQESKQQIELPSAASYFPLDMAVRKKVASTVMLRSQRTDFSRTITGSIGPGQYNIDSQVQGEFGTIGRSHREHHSSANKNPGVGNYNLPNFIGKLPKHCTSPRKVTEAGLSSFQQKMRIRMKEKQSMMRSFELRHKKSEQASMAEVNPENE